MTMHSCILSGAVSGGGGGPVPVTGDPLSFAISNATILSPDVNGHGIFANGWTAALVLKGLSASGNPDAFDGSKVTLSVSDPGYTSSGVATTINRTIKGSISLRTPWPNNALRQITTVGSDLQLIVCLEDIIYQGTTINSVAFVAGAYPGSNALTLTGATVTNGSTRPYPKPYFAWLNRQFERATGSGFNVECVAYHRHGRNGQMVACVEFTGKDPAGHTATVQRASAPALSSIQTRGNIVESWKASVPLSALDQTTSATGVSFVHVKVYPWIGDSSAILDTAVSGVAWPAYDPLQSLSFVNDKNGTYGGGFAYVKAGAGGTPQVGATAATARANPYATIALAYAAVAAWNNTNRSHNDHSGSTIRLMDDGAGGSVTHAQTSGITTAAGLCWSTIEADPLNTAAVQFQSQNAAALSIPDLTAFGSGVTVYNNSIGTGTSSSAIGSTPTSQRLSLDGNVMDMSVGSTPGATYLKATYVWTRNVDWKSPGSKNKAVFTSAASARQAFNLMLGNTAVGGITFLSQYTTIGNVVSACTLSGENVGGVMLDSFDGQIYANNSLFASVQSVLFCQAQNVTYARGVAVVQNVVEMLSNGTLTLNFNVSADGIHNNIAEALDIHNTTLGNRNNWLYTDNSNADGFEKRGVTRFSLLYSRPMKTDTFAQDSGALGSFEPLYGVGSTGVVNTCGAATEIGTKTATVENNAGDPACDQGHARWNGMYRDPNNFVGSGLAGYQTVSFVNDACGFNGTAAGTGPGNGDYHLTGTTNNAYNRVPAGFAMLSFDLGGAARNNAGAGASGAYEH